MAYTDPCFDGVTTLFAVTPCGPNNPPLKTWCRNTDNRAEAQALYGFDVCAREGHPKLPATGATGEMGTAGIGLILVVLGAGLLRLRKKAMR